PAPARAQAVPLGGGDGPVEIEAAESLEWLSEEKLYVARGDAVLRQGEVTVRAETLTAAYRETATGETEIYRMSAEGGIEVTAPDQRITGAQGVYDVDRQVFVVTGGDLRLETPDQVVTATESLEYFEGEGIAVARGDAVAVRGDDRVEADELTAEIEPGPDGDNRITRLGARGDVVITTPTDVARGDEGVYNLETGIATLRGDVRLTRGENQLNGDYAEIDLDSGVSRLLARPGGTRIRGLLVPGSEPGATPGTPAGDPSTNTR
ncbi:MAG: LptA/OstA family protein, partial [Azospirillaceae bacterium]